MEQLYSVKDAAKKLSVAEITVKKWIQSGKLKSVKVGSARRIRESDIMDFIKE